MFLMMNSIGVETRSVFKRIALLHCKPVRKISLKIYKSFTLFSGGCILFKCLNFVLSACELNHSLIEPALYLHSPLLAHSSLCCLGWAICQVGSITLALHVYTVVSRKGMLRYAPCVCGVLCYCVGVDCVCVCVCVLHLPFTDWSSQNTCSWQLPNFQPSGSGCCRFWRLIMLFGWNHTWPLRTMTAIVVTTQQRASDQVCWLCFCVWAFSQWGAVWPFACSQHEIGSTRAFVMGSEHCCSCQMAMGQAPWKVYFPCRGCCHLLKGFWDQME